MIKRYYINQENHIHDSFYKQDYNTKEEVCDLLNEQSEYNHKINKLYIEEKEKNKEYYQFILKNIKKEE